MHLNKHSWPQVMLKKEMLTLNEVVLSLQKSATVHKVKTELRCNFLLQELLSFS